MRKVLFLLALPILLVIGLVGVAVISVGGNASPAQAAACVNVNGKTFNEKEVPNGWGPLVSKAAGVAGVPASVLAAQLEAESNWNPNVTSPVGASGLAQFMPATWASYGQGGDVRNPEHAIAAQGRYMAALVKQLLPLAKSSNADIIKLALAGYNAGPGAVETYKGIPPFAETRAYVDKIMDTAQTKYGESCPASGVEIGALTGKWSHPLPGSNFTSGYGPRPTPPGTLNIGGGFHYGIDFSTPGAGGTVLAVMDMKIVIAHEMQSSSGTWVAGVSLDGKLTATYSHMAAGSLRVKEGDTVSAGTPLGTEGETGNVSGRHLHFEMYSGAPVDPRLGAVDPKLGEVKPIDPTPILKGKGVL
ncbi:peptidoglycan DD-metalloendopeptidase family protein [Paenarthrobacter nitroguajacolicus]